VGLQTLSPVANERLTKVTYGAHHAQTGDKGRGVFNDTIATFRHAFDFSTLTAGWQALKRLAKITKGSIFLLPFAGVAFHDEITGHFHYGFLRIANFFLTLFLFFSFFTLTCLLLGHDVFPVLPHPPRASRPEP